MSEFLVFMLIGALMLFRIVARANAGQRGGAKPQTPAAPKPARPPIPAVRAQKRAQMAQRETWRAAKEQQDDAEQLHAIHIDSCESKLESLRVLYEAGILDKEEYADRVLRTKAKHSRAGGQG